MPTGSISAAQARPTRTPGCERRDVTHVAASVIVNGNAGTGLAENMMSGRVHVKGGASQSAGATGCGGLLVIDGNASARCGIALRGLDIVVKGSVGHMSAFMAQAGNLVVLGDTGDALGDSLYEARLFVRGTVHGQTVIPFGRKGSQPDPNRNDVAWVWLFWSEHGQAARSKPGW